MKNFSDSKPPSKEGISLGKILLAATVLGFILYYKQVAMKSPLGQDPGEEKKFSPERVLIKAPEEFFAGDCIQMTAFLQDKNKAPLKGSSFFLKIKDALGNSVTLFKGPNCSALDLPNLELRLTHAENQVEFHTIINRIGKVSIEASGMNHEPIPLETLGSLDVHPNIKKLKLIFTELPKMVNEYEAFSLKLQIQDIAGNNIDATNEKVRLFLEKGEADGKNLPLAEAQSAGGVVEFRKILIEENAQSKASEVKFLATLGDVSVLSKAVPKKVFKPRHILVDVEGMQTFGGELISPGSVRLIEQVWKLKVKNSQAIVDIKGQEYLLVRLNDHQYKLKKLR